MMIYNPLFDTLQESGMVINYDNVIFIIRSLPCDYVVWFHFGEFYITSVSINDLCVQEVTSTEM